MNKNNQQSGTTCDHCTKKDCKNCFSEDGKTFCCENCRDDFKKQAQSPTKKAETNVCKFC